MLSGVPALVAGAVYARGLSNSTAGTAGQHGGLIICAVRKRWVSYSYLAVIFFLRLELESSPVWRRQGAGRVSSSPVCNGGLGPQ